MTHAVADRTKEWIHGVDEALENGCMVHKMENERQLDKRGTEYEDRAVEINVVKFKKVFCGERIFDKVKTK